MKRKLWLLSLLIIPALMLMGDALAEGAAYPESLHPYDIDSDETFTYTHPTAAFGLQVTFSSDTFFEEEYDYLEVTDGDGLTNRYTGEALSGRDAVPGRKQLHPAPDQRRQHLRIRLPDHGRAADDPGGIRSNLHLDAGVAPSLCQQSL